MSLLDKILGRQSTDSSLKGLQERHQRFHDLIEKNNQMLELMAEAEEMLSGEFIFDSQYLRTFSSQLASASRAIVYDLNAISNNRYPELVKALDKIEMNIKAVLESKTLIPHSKLVIPLSSVNSDDIEVVGGKMARLRELQERGLCRVPDGFVVTTVAFQNTLNLISEQPDLARWLELKQETDESLLNEASLWMKERMSKLRISDDLAQAINDATGKLEKQHPNCVLALRSSALGEDGSLSFAGQYKTLLGVSPQYVMSGYIEVISSHFSHRAMMYRRKNQLPPVGGAMAVGCLCMVRARVAGVLYTLDPTQVQQDVILITSAYGLGKTVVEGSEDADHFTISRVKPHEVLSRTVGKKQHSYIASREHGLRLIDVDKETSIMPSLSDDELFQLCETGLRIERYMKCAQDIEWAFDEEGSLFILQTRPLRIVDSFRDLDEQHLSKINVDNTILMQSRGEVACRGIAFGRVVMVDKIDNLDHLPNDAVLVAKYSNPALSLALTRANAVITDVGTTTGHLATLARELRVPAILDTEIATELFQEGQEITIDAEENVVYLGLVQDLINRHLLSSSAYEDRPEFRMLRKILRKVTPLHVKDPQSSSFTPENCTTYHDVVRFAHEKAVEDLTRGYKIKTSKNNRYTYQLDLSIPLDLLLIDLGGGVDTSAVGSLVTMEQVTSRPLLALLRGLNTEGVWSSEPADMDFNGFMASATRSTMLTSPLANPPQQNLAIINPWYLNLNLKLGYHFNIVDCYHSDKRNDNFIYFRFAGGVTELTRRNRRAAILQQILEKNHFVVDRKKDLVIGRIKKISTETMTERLQMIGRLIGFTRQLDIFLRDDSLIEQYTMGFMSGNYHPSQFMDINQPKRGLQMNESKKVMVLDDEDIVCQRSKSYLEKEGYQVETFTVSQQAMERLQQERFDVVVSDLKMKPPSGLEILRFVRSLDQGTQMVIITGYGSIEAIREAECTDVIDFICKPFQMEVLGAAVRKAVKKAKKVKKQKGLAV